MQAYNKQGEGQKKASHLFGQVGRDARAKRHGEKIFCKGKVTNFPRKNKEKPHKSTKNTTKHLHKTTQKTFIFVTATSQTPCKYECRMYIFVETPRFFFFLRLQPVALVLIFFVLSFVRFLFFPIFAPTLQSVARQLGNLN